jgi:flagellar biosynthesis protein FlhF
MRIRKFTARSMAEALNQVKTEFGDAAVLLRTRALNPRTDGRAGFEVTAAHDPEPVAPPREARAPFEPAPVPAPAATIAAPSGPATVVPTLVARGVEEVLARRLADAWQKKSRPGVALDLEQALAALIPVKNSFQVSGQPVVIALVGPTGVGKTTSLAKLAAHFLLERKWSVGLITADTHRIAAVEQLQGFARLMGTSLEVAYSAAEMATLRDAMRAQVVLVDTPGVGPLDEAGMGQLKQMLTAARPDQVHLCLSAATRTQDLRLAAAKFAALGCDRILFTKLDETATTGQLLTALAETRLPVSYVTCGQVVPGDFYPASPERLARQILGGEPDVEAVRSALGA